jgi:hypothetical protein
MCAVAALLAALGGDAVAEAASQARSGWDIIDFWGRHLGAAIGIGLVAIAFIMGFAVRQPSQLQAFLIIGAFSLGCGGIAGEIAGTIKTDITLGQQIAIGATGAIAVFAALIGVYIFYFRQPQAQ